MTRIIFFLGFFASYIDRQTDMSGAQALVREREDNSIVFLSG